MYAYMFYNRIKKDIAKFDNYFLVFFVFLHVSPSSILE